MSRHLVQLRARVLELRLLPRSAKAGMFVIAAGLALDAVVHSLGIVTAGSLAAFAVRQHLAHLLVLVGMVVTLAGVVADGVRNEGRLDRPRRRSSHAVR